MAIFKYVLFIIFTLAAVFFTLQFVGFFAWTSEKNTGLSFNDGTPPNNQPREIQRPPAGEKILAPFETGSGFQPPMASAKERISKKTFGMYISPESSPVKPDKFRGFHAGADWEILAGEAKIDVPVLAVCSGPRRLKKNASGYGGVIVQECELNGEPITVIYGHLRLLDAPGKPGQELKAGDLVGYLGAGQSSQTDGARKHLHLAFHRGKDLELRGYLASEDELSAYIDPCLYVCQN